MGTVTAVSIAVGRGDALSRRSSADPAGSLASHGADGGSSSEEPGAGRRAGGAETASGPSMDGYARPPAVSAFSGPRGAPRQSAVALRDERPRPPRRPRTTARAPLGFSSVSFVPGVHGPCVAKASRAVRRSSVSEDRAERARGWGPCPHLPGPSAGERPPAGSRQETELRKTARSQSSSPRPEMCSGHPHSRSAPREWPRRQPGRARAGLWPLVPAQGTGWILITCCPRARYANEASSL